jgi:hypothetical protein
MKSGKPKKSLARRIKTFVISTLLIVVLIESILLYRLSTVHIDKEKLSLNEFDEIKVSGSDFASKVKRLRHAFSDTSADAWAAAQESSNPDDAWFDIGYRPRADLLDQKMPTISPSMCPEWIRLNSQLP